MNVSELLGSSNQPYKIKLIATLNPHVFWIEPILDIADGSKEFHIIQAGLANVFPADVKCIDPIYQTQRFSSTFWMPAGKRLLHNAVAETHEAYFLPLHVMPDEFAILNETKCIFGELFVIKNDESVSITKMMMECGVLYRSTKRFQKYLHSEVIFIDQSGPELDSVVQTVLDYANNKDLSSMQGNKTSQDPTGVRKLVNQFKTELGAELSGHGDFTKVNKVLRVMDDVYNKCISIAEKEIDNGVRILKDKSENSPKSERSTPPPSGATCLKKTSQTVASQESDVKKNVTKLIYMPAGANMANYHHSNDVKSPDPKEKKKHIEKYLEGVRRSQKPKNKDFDLKNYGNSSSSNISCDSKSSVSSTPKECSFNSNNSYLSSVGFSECDESLLSDKENKPISSNSSNGSHLKVRLDESTSCARKLKFVRSSVSEKSSESMSTISRNTSNYQGSSEETDSSVSTVCSNNNFNFKSLENKPISKFVDEQLSKDNSPKMSTVAAQKIVSDPTKNILSSKSKFFKQRGDIASMASVDDSETNSIISTSCKIKKNFFELNKTNMEKPALNVEHSEKNTVASNDDSDSNSVVSTISTSHQAKCRFLKINSAKSVTKAVATRSSTDTNVVSKESSSRLAKCNFFRINSTNNKTEGVITESNSTSDVNSVVSTVSTSHQVKRKFLGKSAAICESKVAINSNSASDVESVVSTVSTSHYLKCKFLGKSAAICESKVPINSNSASDVDSVVSTVSTSHHLKCKFLGKSAAICESKVAINSNSASDVESVVSTVSTSHYLKCKFLGKSAAICESKVPINSNSASDVDSVVSTVSTSHHLKCKFLGKSAAICESKVPINSNSASDVESVVSTVSMSHHLKCKFLGKSVAICESKVPINSNSASDVESVVSTVSTSHRVKCKFLGKSAAICESKVPINSNSASDVDSVISTVPTSHHLKCKFLGKSAAICESKVPINSNSASDVDSVISTVSTSHRVKCKFLGKSAAICESKVAATRSSSVTDEGSAVLTESHGIKRKFLGKYNQNCETKDILTNCNSVSDVDSVVSTVSASRQMKSKFHRINSVDNDTKGIPTKSNAEVTAVSASRLMKRKFLGKDKQNCETGGVTRSNSVTNVDKLDSSLISTCKLDEDVSKSTSSNCSGQSETSSSGTSSAVGRHHSKYKFLDQKINGNNNKTALNEKDLTSGNDLTVKQNKSKYKFLSNSVNKKDDTTGKQCDQSNSPEASSANSSNKSLNENVFGNKSDETKSVAISSEIKQNVIEQDLSESKETPEKKRLPQSRQRIQRKSDNQKSDVSSESSSFKKKLSTDASASKSFDKSKTNSSTDDDDDLTRPESFSSPISCSSLNLNFDRSRKTSSTVSSGVDKNDSVTDLECDPDLIEEHCNESSNSSGFSHSWNITNPLGFKGIKGPFFLQQGPIALKPSNDEEKLLNDVVMFNDYAQCSYYDDLVEKVVSPKVVIHSESGEMSPPIKDLESTHFSSVIINNLGSLNVKMPTKLQSSVWPIAFRDRSTFVIGTVNSGRSLSVLAPICNKLPKIMLSNLPDGIGPVVTIVCPNTFATNTVYTICKTLLKDCSMATGDSFKIVKLDDRNDSNNLFTIMSGVDLLITTAQCLYDILSADMSILNFHKLQYVLFEDLDVLNNQFYFETKKIIDEFEKIQAENVRQKSQQFRMYATSQIWCEYLEKLAMKSYNPTLVVSSLQECLFYSKPQLSVALTKESNKLKRLESIVHSDPSVFRRIVIVCKSDEEIDRVQTLLKDDHIMCIAGPSMTIDLLNDVRKSWRNHNLCTSSIVMITCDESLHFLDINNAQWLIHYSLPKTYSRFNLRFSTMSNNFPNLYKPKKDKALQLKVDLLITEDDLMRLPKLSQFIERFDIKIPNDLNHLMEKIINQKDVVKAITFVPLCERLAAFGYCPDTWSCIERHSLVKQDYPRDWLPRTGRVKCRITAIQHPSLYSARILEYIDFNGKRHTVPQKHVSLLLELHVFFSSEGNRRHHKSAKCGDICAVQIDNDFKRCQVLRIIPTNERKDLDIIRVVLLDEECYVDLKRCDLLHLPEHFQSRQTSIVKIRLAGVLPSDDNDFWSSSAIRKVKTLFNFDKNLIIQGNIVLGIGNTLWLDDIKICKHLDNLNVDIVVCNLKSNLISNGLAVSNTRHVQVLYDLCKRFDFNLPTFTRPSKKVVKKMPFEPQWAHLNEDFIDVHFSHAESLGLFFIRHVAYNKSLENLENDLLSHVNDMKSKFINADAEISEESVERGYYCIALFDDDDSYNRAKVLKIVESNGNFMVCKCLFVDHGETRTVRSNDIYPITEELVRQLPFQAIECRFYGIKPMLEEWNDSATDKLYDFSFVGDSNDLKILVTKYYTKEKAQSTGGNKYGIILVDCAARISFTDFVINERLVLPVVDEIENIKNDEIQNLFKVVEYDENEDDDCQSADLNIVDWTDDDEDIDAKWDCQFTKEDYENLLKRDHLPRICRKAEEEKKEHFVETTKDVDVRKIIPFVVGDNERSFKTPRVLWHQTNEHVTIKIMLADVNIYECLLRTKTLYFETNLDYVRYRLDIELFACIKESKSQHTAKGMYVFIRLYKHIQMPWESLTASNSIVNNKLIVYDPDFVFVEDEIESDGEEKRLKESLQKHIKSMDDDQSDSEDDDCSDVQLLSATDRMISREIIKKMAQDSIEENDDE